MCICGVICIDNLMSEKLFQYIAKTRLMFTCVETNYFFRDSLLIFFSNFPDILSYLLARSLSLQMFVCLQG